MEFSISPEYLIEDVAKPLKSHLKTQYGNTGLKVEKEVDPTLSWRPTIQIKTSRFCTLGVEVSDQLYPVILKIAAHDINAGFYKFPVQIAVACPLAVYQNDTRQTDTNKLRKDGVGLFTVDDQGVVVEQFASTAIMHHINEDLFETKIKGLPQAVKVKLRSAYKIYRTNCYQGTQDAGQLIEAIVMGFAQKSHSAGLISSFNKRDTPAIAIDNLYGSTNNNLTSQRAAFGGARNYMRYFRNLSSHPPKNTAEAVKLISDCRDGFLQALSVAVQLNTAINSCGLKIRLYAP